MRTWLVALALTACAFAQPLTEDPDYQAGQTALEQSKYARARELAEKVLRSNKDHYPALVLLGEVYRYGEGSLPRAYYCFARARRIMEKSYSQPAVAEDCWRLYAVALQELAGCAGQMEKYDEACKLIDLYDENFNPKHTAWKGFPMLKMGRFNEARELMLKLLNDPAQRESRGHILNTLGNIEFETDNLQKSYEYFQQIAEEEKNGSDVDPVYWSNAAEAARDLLRYDEAEKLYLESTKHYNQYTYSDPWGSLAELYAAENRMPEALEALKSMQAWRISGSAQVSQNKWAGCYAHAGSVLMQMGYDEEALGIFRRLVRRQDRNSSISTPAPLVEARMLYQYACVLQLHVERLRERLSYCRWRQVPGLLAELWQAKNELSSTRTRVANLVCSSTGLIGLVQPFGSRALDQPPLSAATWAFFGPGPTIAAVQETLRQSRPEIEARKPYLLAVMGEALHHDFQQDEARQALEQALQTLSPAEVKLRLRCQAVLARMLAQRGRHEESTRLLQQLMDQDPSQLRACELPLPVDIRSSGESGAQHARSYLYRSPRCQRARGRVFTLTLRGDREVEGELSSPDGTRLGTFRGQPRNSSADAASSFCEVFHQQAFAPIIDLSQADIHSIDGYTGVARPDQLKKLVQ